MMAEDEDGSSIKNSNTIDSECANHDSQPEHTNETNSTNNLEIGPDRSAGNLQSEDIKDKDSNKKEDNPFSFRHFLKRDLSLPGNSTFENTGARPKVYAKTVQHSPKKAYINYSTNKDKSYKETNGGYNSESSSSIDVPSSVVDNSESKSNLYINYFNSGSASFQQSPTSKIDNIGMPSLPDFVQDHILVEQAYLNTNGPVSVDLDNLPDFTYNTNFDSASTPSLGRRNNRSYNCDDFVGESDVSSRRMRNGANNGPLDLPPNLESVNQSPLDLPQHLSLDLTESINTAERRNPVDARNNHPLDLPSGNAGAEGLRLPDFLPVQPNRTSPDPDYSDRSIHQVVAELERTRSQLASERAHRIRLETELATLRQRAYNHEPQPSTSSGAGSNPEATITMLRNQLRILQEQHLELQEEILALRRSAASQLRRAADAADTSLRDLLAGVEQLRRLGGNLYPTL